MGATSALDGKRNSLWIFWSWLALHKTEVHHLAYSEEQLGGILIPAVLSRVSLLFWAWKIPCNVSRAIMRSFAATSTTGSVFWEQPWASSLGVLIAERYEL
jgi:hypothetical protein